MSRPPLTDEPLPEDFEDETESEAAEEPALPDEAVTDFVFDEAAT